MKFLFRLHTRGKKVKGAALYVAIMVSLIMTVLLSMFMVLAHFQQRSVLVYAQQVQLYCNLKSAMGIAQSAYFDEALNDVWFRNEGNEDSLKICKRYWGAYLLLQVQTKNRHATMSDAGLFGTCMSRDTGLVVNDHGRPVGVSGQVIFKAMCYLPKPGLRPAFIEGQSYDGGAGNHAFVKTSPLNIPELSADFVAAMTRQMVGPDVMRDSLVNVLDEVCVRGFNQKTLSYAFAGTRLQQLRLSGNICVYAGDLEVDSSAKLNQVLIVCDKVRFKKGFRGQVHVLAKDSIVMEEGCRFDFPSSLVLWASNGAPNGLAYIQLNKDCKVFGAVVAACPEEGDTKVLIKTHAGSELSGLVYSRDYLHVEGKLYANVYAGKLLLKTPSAVYENHLLSCEVDPARYSQVLRIPAALASRVDLYRCKAL